MVFSPLDPVVGASSRYYVHFPTDPANDHGNKFLASESAIMHSDIKREGILDIAKSQTAGAASFSPVTKTSPKAAAAARDPDPCWRTGGVALILIKQASLHYD